jgi:hypothetical protein
MYVVPVHANINIHTYTSACLRYTLCIASSYLSWNICLLCLRVFAQCTIYPLYCVCIYPFSLQIKAQTIRASTNICVLTCTHVCMHTTANLHTHTHTHTHGSFREAAPQCHSSTIDLCTHMYVYLFA